MNQEESSHEVIPPDSIELIDTISDSFDVKLNSDNQANIEYYKQKGEMGTDGYGVFKGQRVPIANPGGGFSDGTLKVTGFDYSNEYIASDKTENNAGHKLIVVIKDVVPNNNVTSSGTTLYSNQDGAGISVLPNDSLGKFRKPYISRHSYTLDVDSDSSKFNVTPTIVNAEGNVVDKSDPALEDVIIVYPDGTRKNYSKVGPQTFANMKNRNAFYFENVPEDYKVKTAVQATDTSYTYTWVTGDGIKLSASEPKSSDLNYADSVIKITSVANNRIVTIKEKVDGPYSYKEDTFTPTIELTPAADAVDVPDQFIFDGLILSKDSDGVLKGTVTTPIKGDEEAALTISVPVGWTLKITQPGNDKYETKSYSKSVDKGDATVTEGTTMTFEIPDGATDITILNESKDISIESYHTNDNGSKVILIMLGTLALLGGAVVYVCLPTKEN